MSKKQEGKVVSVTLDSLPYGDSADNLGRVRKRQMPPGVTRKMLLKDVLLIAWPSFVELVLTQLTSMADQVMVGRLPGEEGLMALSAVGLAAQPKFLLMTLIQALNVGATAVIARFRGQQNRERANQVFKQALILNLFMSIVFMIVGLFSSEWLIKFMSASGVTDTTLSYGTRYLDIQLYGFVPMCMTITVTAALRGIGDSRTPMIYNTVANVVNLMLNYVMIYGKFGCPAMGVEGAAWATIIGQTVAFVIASCVVLMKKRYIYLDFKEKFKFDKGLMANVISIGVPSMVEQLFMRAGIIIYTRLVAGLGETLYATHQICMSVQAMSFMIGQAFANAATTLMGQSLGKRRRDMAEIYMRETRNIGILVSFVLMALMVLLNKNIVALYNSNEDVIEIGGKILILLAASQPFQADQFIVSGGLRGAGDTRYTAIVIMITVLGVRSGFCAIAMNVLDWGLWGAWIALVADQCLRTLLMAVRYSSGRWKRIGAKREKSTLSEA
ncbi:MAG: MATE family efflux transporter [Oscillospiraceae bacterium]